LAEVLAASRPCLSHAGKLASEVSVFESVFYAVAYFGFPVAIKVSGGQKAMSQRNKAIVFGAIVMAITGLGLALSTLHNTAALVASAVWGS
jgi:hypothetical protein